MTPRDPTLDPADAGTALADILARRQGYYPDFAPENGGAGYALLAIVARFREILGKRLNRLPDKDAIAFLDLLGYSLVGPRAARAPVVFNFQPPATPELPGPVRAAMESLGVPVPAAMPAPPLLVRAPAGTSVAATLPGGGEPVSFETEQDIGLVAGPIAQVVSLIPGQDAYADHTADLASGKPTVLFQPTATTPHILYLAHETLFALNGQVVIEIELSLAAAGTQALVLAWEFFDGKAWRPFGEPAVKDAPDATEDGTQGLTRSGVVTLHADNAKSKATTVNGRESQWLRARLDMPLPPDPGRVDALVQRLRVCAVTERLLDPTVGFEFSFTDKTAFLAFAETVRTNPQAGLRPDQAMAQGATVDVSKPFGPFGPTPSQGAEFAFTSEEVFSKPGAEVRLLVLAEEPVDPKAALSAVLAWEFWDGDAWNAIPADAVITAGSRGSRFDGCCLFAFTVPEAGIPPTKLQNQPGRWVRVRVDSGDFTIKNVVNVPTGNNTTTPINFETNFTPLIRDLRLSYVHRPVRQAPSRCVTYNDFSYEDHSATMGVPYAAFHAVADLTPALYLGFPQALPSDYLSLFFYLNADGAASAATNPPLAWEGWDGQAWIELGTRDDTANLARPGMLAFVGLGGNGDTRLPRFGQGLWWVRGRYRDDAEPVEAALAGLYLNAVWASQAQTVTNETLGSGTGEPSQSFFATRPPVLEGEVVEVRELEGMRAALELPILASTVPADALRVVTDPRGRPREVWVRWQFRTTALGVAPDDRIYVLERTRGRFQFGGGKAIPPGKDNVLLRSYRTGGGAQGNVPAGAITQLLAGIPFVSGTTNPIAAEAGSDGESLAEVRTRGPESVRNRGRAVSASDYEALAREASPAVAVARAVATTDPAGRTEAGWVKLVIMPRSQEPRPQPSFGLKQQVGDYIRARGPADLGGLSVVGPDYWPVGVNVAIASIDLTQSGPVAQAVREALGVFLHPLSGGPDGQGWPPGRAVYLSDAAAVVEAVSGVDFASTLELTLDGIPQGERVDIPADRVVVAGPIKVSIARTDAGGRC